MSAAAGPGFGSGHHSRMHRQSGMAGCACTLRLRSASRRIEMGADRDVVGLFRPQKRHERPPGPGYCFSAAMPHTAVSSVSC